MEVVLQGTRLHSRKLRVCCNHGAPYFNCHPWKRGEPVRPSAEGKAVQSWRTCSKDQKVSLVNCGQEAKPGG